MKSGVVHGAGHVLERQAQQDINKNTTKLWTRRVRTEGGVLRGGLFTTFATVAAVGCRYRGTSPPEPPSAPDPSDRSAFPPLDAGAPALADNVRCGGADAFAGDAPPADLTGDGDADTCVGVGDRVCLAATTPDPENAPPA